MNGSIAPKLWFNPCTHQGEFTCARDHFYRYVTAKCEETERQRARAATSTAGNLTAEGRSRMKVGLTPDEECWAARAIFGAASMGLRESNVRHAYSPVVFATPMLNVYVDMRCFQ